MQAPIALDFTLPLSGHALRNGAGFDILDVSGAFVAHLAGSPPAQYFGPVDGLVFGHEDGSFWQIAPGAASATRVTQPVADPRLGPGWVDHPDGVCATHSLRPEIQNCWDRLVVYDGSGVTTTIDKPASMRVGHWAAAALSPDRNWVAGSWSAECESYVGFLVPIGGPPTGLRASESPDNDRPGDSSFLTWLDTGEVAWAANNDCGEEGPTSVYRTTPGGETTLWFTATGPFAVW